MSFLIPNMLLYKNTSRVVEFHSFRCWIVLQPLCWVWISLAKCSQNLAHGFQFWCSTPCRPTKITNIIIHTSYMHWNNSGVFLRKYCMWLLLCGDRFWDWELPKLPFTSKFLVGFESQTSVNVINNILPTVINQTRSDIFDANWGWKWWVPLILRGLVTIERRKWTNKLYINRRVTLRAVPMQSNH